MHKVFSYVVLLPTWITFLIMTIFLFVSSKLTVGYTLFSCILLFWLLSVGLLLHNKVPVELKKSVTWFKINIYYAITLSIIIGLSTFRQIDLVIPFQLYGIYSFFYALYFVSRSLVVAEEGSKVGADRYLGTLFLFWFAPVGIWFLNPRINNIVN
jgi:hypothetical protein